MKGWLVALAGLAALAAAIALSPASAEPHGHWRGGGEGHQGREGGEFRRGPGPVEPWEGREEWPGAGASRWDEQRHDGYWLGSHWHYGPPPVTTYGDPELRPGFAPWRRGAYLPPYYGAYVVPDYGRFHLRRPPYGYHWVRVGESFLLVSASTGLIFDVVNGF